MLNYWWVTRPKRKLDSIPEVLAQFAEISLNQEWTGQREYHLAYEAALEKAGLKRVGDRRDQTGGGARTYKAWLKSLGLIFTQESTGLIRLTLAGEALMNGDPPVPVLTNQILKYQFPSSFSVGRGVDVAARFRIHPFRFLLRLLADDRIQTLSEEEIAKIVVTEADNETESCYEHIVSRLLEFRVDGDSCLDPDFFLKYQSSKGGINLAKPFSHLTDLANTLIKWLEYTQLISRERDLIRLLPEKQEVVWQILSKEQPLIDKPAQEEYFQRRYGVDPKHTKDTRNLNESRTITPKMIAAQKVQQAYIALSLKRPITKISTPVVDYIVARTGIDPRVVEEILIEKYPHGSPSAFMSEYFSMAFKGREEAADFEKATVELFQNVFGYEASHVGPIGRSPDVLLESKSAHYQAILDNKAYSRYTVSNDHHNRMVDNYIRDKAHYSTSPYPLAFFSYIAGGFGSNIDPQIQSIVHDGGVNGSCITVSNVIQMVENSETKPYTHEKLRQIFGLNRQVLISDLQQ